MDSPSCPCGIVKRLPPVQHHFSGCQLFPLQISISIITLNLCSVSLSSYCLFSFDFTMFSFNVTCFDHLSEFACSHSTSYVYLDYLWQHCFDGVIICLPNWINSFHCCSFALYLRALLCTSRSLLSPSPFVTIQCVFCYCSLLWILVVCCVLWVSP